MEKDWTDDEGRFLFGKYRGYSAEHVVLEEPSYIKWIVEEVENVSESDRKYLKVLLDRKGR